MAGVEREEAAAMDERHATLHVLPTAAHPPRACQDGPAPAAPPGPAAVRVHVVSADPLARVGVRTLLEGDPGIRVTGESTPEPEAAAGPRAHRPHILVVHGPLPADRTEFPARAAADNVRVLTMGEAAGPPGAAHGHPPGTATAGRPARAVVRTAAGCTLPHETAARSRRTAAVSQVCGASPDQLTERACEVLELPARGLSSTGLRQPC
ncbi:response regulator transcription factor [Streptomyces sp. 4N124]|uniref:response regulator transcription factor n=1 Tax=Streptomyces sp. 4N124 TaxID=3457420 RepID=UPI003FCF7794